jgi:hypothetical protein
MEISLLARRQPPLSVRRAKGASLQWEEDIPPGNCRSSRKQPERLRRATVVDEASGAKDRF